MALNVKKGDNVLVLTGKDNGKTGKVLSVNPKSGRIVVEGVNVITKHNKPRSAQVPGGIEKTNGTIDASNVMVICPTCGKATRVAAGEENGKKIRACKKCGASLEAKKAEKKVRKSAKKAAAAEENTTEVAAEEKAPAKKTAAKKTTSTKSTAAKSTTAKKTTSKKAEEPSEK